MAPQVLGFYVGYNDGSLNVVPPVGAPRSMSTVRHGPQRDGAGIFAVRWRDEASAAELMALVHTSGHGGTDLACDPQGGTRYPAPGYGIPFDTLATNTLALPGSQHAIAIRGSDDVPAGLGPSSPFRVSVCVARTLNATGQFLSLR